MANIAKEKKSPTRNIALLNQINKLAMLIGVQINRKNIGTGTVDYWLWIMDQEPRDVFGQYIAA